MFLQFHIDSQLSTYGQARLFLSSVELVLSWRDVCLVQLLKSITQISMPDMAKFILHFRLVFADVGVNLTSSLWLVDSSYFFLKAFKFVLQLSQAEDVFVLDVLSWL